MEFKISVKGCRYVDGKKVSKKRYEELEKQCKSFDTFYTAKDGSHYKYGRTN
jgi:hypothetical protein